MKLKNAAIVIPSLFITMLFTQSLFAQASGDSRKQAEKGDAAIAQEVTTKDGRGVILNTNGTWQYKNASGSTTAPGNATASAIETVRAYLMASYVNQRIPFVLNQDKVKPLMESRYGKGKFNVSKFEILTDTEPTPTKTGFVKIDAELVDEVVEYYLKKTKDGYRIDWEASVGYNPISVEEFRVLKPTKPVRLRVSAKLDDYYNYGFEHSEHINYSILIRSNGKEWGYGYVEKNTETGQKLFKILKDCKYHSMVVDVRFPQSAREGSVFFISDVINFNGWDF